MKNVSISVKVLAGLLALCILLSAAPLAAFAAEAVATTADFSAADGGVAALALLNQAKTGAADSAWDSGSKTLTLRGIDFTTTAATAVKLPAGSTIVLADGSDNRIRSGDVSIQASGKHKNQIYITALDALGNLTIQGGTAGTGTLSVTSGTHKNSGDAWTYSSAISVYGDFTVKGGHVTAQGGKAYSADIAFSLGVNMENDKRNKALLVTGGSLTAIAGESFDTENPDDVTKSFSQGVYMYRGNVIVSGNGKLRAESVPSMVAAGVLSNGLYISVGDLLIANEGEVSASGAYGVYISGGGIRLDSGKLTAISTKTPDDYGNAIDVERDSLGINAANAGNIRVGGGTLETVNGGVYMSALNPADDQGIFAVTGGTVKLAGDLYGAHKVDISGGTVQTEQIKADELTLSNAALTVRESVKKSAYSGNLYTSPALWLRNLTVNSGTLDVAWDWGEYMPIVFPVDEYDGFPTPLVRMWGETYVAAFNGGTTILDTGCAGNLAMMLGRLALGEDMEETGADKDQHQLRGDTPVKFAAATAKDLINEAVITDAKFDYQPGDAPQAGAKVSDADKYEIAYEYWEEMQKGENGAVTPVAYWYSDADRNNALASDERITTFEEGKTYMYSLMLKVKDGYAFADDCPVTVNNTAVNAVNVTKTADGLFVTAVKTIMPRGSVETPDYRIVEGADGVWEQKSDGTLTFRATGELAKLTDVKVDGTSLGETAYTAGPDSTVVTLTNAYLASLSVGKHTLTVVYTDGECSASFEIRAGGHDAYTMGDVNGDGQVDTADAVLVLQRAAKLIDDSQLNVAAADVNGDKTIDTADAVLILQRAAKLIEKFPTEG